MATYYLPNETGWTSSQTSATYLRIKVDQSYNSSTNKSALTITLQARDTDGYREYNVLDDALFTGGGTTFIQGGGGSGYISPRLEFNTPSGGSWANMIDAGGSAKSFSLAVNHDASGAASVAFGVNIGMRDYDGTKPRSFYSKSATLSLQNTPSYTLSISAGTGSSITVKRGSTTLSHGATIYRGDVLTITFGTSTGYDLATHTVNGSTFASGGTHTVTGAVSVVSTAALKTYTVSYNANGGTGAPSSQTKTYGVTLTLSSTTPTRANSSAGSYTVTYDANGGSVSPTSASAARTTSYAFSSWNTVQGGGGASYSPGGSYTTNAAAILYAQWSSTTTTASVTLPTPTRTGYTFSGWYTSGGTKVGNAGASYTPTGSVTLYAHWSINSYTVTCSDRIGSSSGTVLGSSTASYNYGSSVSGASFGSSTAYDAYYTGYHYTGSSNAVTVTGATTVYRYFALNTWTVGYNANGGTASTVPASQTKTYNQTLTLSTARPKRDNASAGSYTVTLNANGGSVSPSSLPAARTTSYAFNSWNTNSTGTGATYSPGGSYTTNAAATLYAKWSSFTSTASVTLPTPSRTGYTFMGWSTDQSASSGITGSYTPSGNVTLYATWKIKTYSLSISQGNGTTVSVTRGGTPLSDGAVISHFDVLSITITARTGYSIGTHTVNGTSWNSGSYTVSGNVAVVATASIITFGLSLTKPLSGIDVNVLRTASPIGGGQIGLLDNGAVLYCNDEIKVSYTVRGGYELQTATVNGVDISGSSEYSVTATGNVSVVFAVKLGAIVYIGNVAYQAFIGDGAAWHQYEAFIGDGTRFVAY